MQLWESWLPQLLAPPYLPSSWALEMQRRGVILALMAFKTSLSPGLRMPLC